MVTSNGIKEAREALLKLSVREFWTAKAIWLSAKCKPCPRCKSKFVEPKYTADPQYPLNMAFAIDWAIVCDNCHLEGPQAKTADESVEAWNAKV